MTTSTAPTHPETPENLTARRVTDILQPRNVLLAGMLGIGLAAAGGHWSGLLWGFLGALCAASYPPATSNGSADAAPGATATWSTAPSARRSSSSSSAPSAPVPW
ncbi:hypothetical protein ACFQVA_21065 [Actinomadura keratinilytica]